MVFITSEHALSTEYYAIALYDLTSKYLVWLVSDIVTHQIDYKTKELLHVYAKTQISYQFQKARSGKHKLALVVFNYPRVPLRSSSITESPRVHFPLAKWKDFHHLNICAYGEFFAE